jgi:peptide/nickel transport system substrate-binding protein
MLAGVAGALLVLTAASAKPATSGRYGGVLVVGLSRGAPGSLDPTFLSNVSTVEVLRTICQRLYDFDARSRVVPELAAQLPTISPDKLTYTIPLRQGIEFNDGTPFNAQAVKATIERDIKLPRSSRAGDYQPVISVTAPSRYTVVITLSSPYTPMTKVLASADGVIMSPTQLEKLGDNFGTDPVCVGPFMFENRDVNYSVTVVKSPYYYRRRDVHLDKVVYMAETDANAAVATLRAGGLQALDSIPSTSVSTLEHAEGLRVMHAESLGFVAVFVNMGNTHGIGSLPYGTANNALASSPKLRQAFEEAIQRKTLNRVVFGGRELPGCTPVSRASPTFAALDEGIKCTPYDPAGARKLVAASGIANPTVHLLTPNQSEMLRLATFIQAEERAVGIDVVIDSTDMATGIALTNQGKFDAYLGSWSGSPDTDRQFFQFLATKGSLNRSGYSNPRLDTILANARMATKDKKIASLYRAAQRIILADRPMIYLYHPIVYAAVAANVSNVQLPFDLLLRVAFAEYR